MGVSFNIKRSYVWKDPMNNGNNWFLKDDQDLTEFSGGQWLKTGKFSLSNSTSLFSSRYDGTGYKWQLASAPFEFIMEFEVNEVGGDGGVCFLYIEEDIYFRSGEFISVGIEANTGGANGMVWQTRSDAYSGGSSFDFGNPSLGMNKVKIAQDANNNMTAWVWENNQWEWDGDPNGLSTIDSKFTLNLNVRPYFADSSVNDYVLGGVDEVTLLSGTRIVY